MGKTFILVENPQSFEGDKRMNVRPDKEYKASDSVLNGKVPKKGDKEDLKRARKYADRYALMERLRELNPYDLVDSRLTESIDEAKNFAHKKNDFDLACTGSLNSMLKSVINTAEIKGRKYDTLVFIGHGNVGFMSVGAGKLGLPRPPQTTERLGKKDFKLQEARETLGIDKREMSAANVATWGPLFNALRPALEVDTNNAVHVFFLGCCTHDNDNGIPRFTVTAASSLSQQLRQNWWVYAYGFEAEIEQTDVNTALNSLTAIKNFAVANPGGNFPLGGADVHWHRVQTP